MKTLASVFNEAISATEKLYTITKTFSVIARTDNNELDEIEEGDVWTKSFSSLEEIAKFLSKELKADNVDWTSPGNIAANHDNASAKWERKYKNKFKELNENELYEIKRNGKVINKKESIEIDKTLKLGAHNL